jgi:negative regulator of sigma E activity
MNPDNRIPELMDTPVDKFHAHYRQQLSALVDGELAPDEARFMLRRIEHDGELSGCQERWQLLGDAMRGQACAPAPGDFGLKVRQAIAADIGQYGPVSRAPRQIARSGWRRWGGGAALAASVAAVALFMAREQLPETAMPDPVIATTAQITSPAVPAANGPAPGGADAAASVASASAVAVAAARRQEATRRGSATRSRQSARASAVRMAEPPQRAIAAAPSLPAVTPISPVLRQDPFGSSANTLQARPWPRSSVAPSLGQGALNASFPAQQERSGTFYPFEPRLPEQGGDTAELRRLLPRQ